MPVFLCATARGAIGQHDPRGLGALPGRDPVTRGSLRLSMTFSGQKRVEMDVAGGSSGISSRVLWEGMEEEKDYHFGPVQDFADAILENRMPRTDLRKALTIQRIFDAVYASAASGGPARIED